MKRRVKPFPGLPEGPAWVLVPLGNPGEEYARTRHNLGRLLLQRWMKGRPAPVLREFRTGTLYALEKPFLALVPATYMNLSGQVCGEAVAAGMEASRLVLLHDDKDLPLGMGRFRLEGGDGGHNGLKSIFEHLGTQAVPRLRLGIGPFTRPLDRFVLGEWNAEEARRMEALDEAFARFLEVLGAAQELSALAGSVNAQRFWEPGAQDPGA